MTRCRFLVTYGRNVARFTNRQDAIRFARMASVVGSIWTADAGTEVHAPDGIIAQFDDGKATPEFAHLDAA